MLRQITGLVATTLALVTTISSPFSSRAAFAQSRWFADRPVAWEEHDDEHVERAPAPTHLQDLDQALLLRDSIANEIERVLSLDVGRPAEDINALDEVPCSTWFCPRNHLRPMTPLEVAAGPPGTPPRLPLSISKGKEGGAASGFQVRDADGRKYMLKFDPVGHPGMASGAEMVGERLFHAAGYNVAGSYLLDLDPSDLRLSPQATFRLYEVQPRPLTEHIVREQLSRAARSPSGRIRAVAVPWIPGGILGGYDNIGRRKDDPNDRIPHERRRSLRASWVLFAWLGEFDPSSKNSIDSYVEEAGRRFVRHYVLDFGTTLGSATNSPKPPQRTGEYLIEVGRTLAAWASFGLYRRPFQDDRADWDATVARLPAAGWFPAEDFDPDAFRTNRKVPSHARRTDRDLYWGAKVVTSFSDAQITAVVATGSFPETDRAYLEHALRVRRDIIGRRYLRAMTALEAPVLSAGGDRLCFQDLAIARGYARRADVRYQIEATDGYGNVVAASEQPAAGLNTCVPIGAVTPSTGYRIVSVRARLAADERARAAVAKVSRVHLRWREGEGRYVVVGLERDE